MMDFEAHQQLQQVGQPNAVCSCLSELQIIREQTQAPCLDAWEIFDVSERLIAATSSSAAHCEQGCYLSTSNTRSLLESIGRVLDIFDALWSASEEAARPTTMASSSGARGIIPGSRGHQESMSSTTTTVTVMGMSKAVASVNRYVLDDAERQMLLQEMLRGSMASMNAIVEDVHRRVVSRHADQSASSLPWDVASNRDFSTPSALDGLVDLSSNLLERTYAGLARYGASLALL